MGERSFEQPTGARRFDDLVVLYEDWCVDETFVLAPHAHQHVRHGSPAALRVARQPRTEEQFGALAHQFDGVVATGRCDGF